LRQNEILVGVDDLRARKLAHNEALFREVNETIAAARFDSRETRFICECSDENCALTVLLTRKKYEQIRARGSRFFLLPGHELPEIEEVVEMHAGYYVIEKTVPVPE
jgi:hypothetical protein